MTREEAAYILDPETTREALLPYALDGPMRLAVVEEACRVAVKALRKSGSQARYPCRGCVYFDECGHNMRTEPCEGRLTKRQRKGGKHG